MRSKMTTSHRHQPFIDAFIDPRIDLDKLFLTRYNIVTLTRYWVRSPLVLPSRFLHVGFRIFLTRESCLAYASL